MVEVYIILITKLGNCFDWKCPLLDECNLRINKAKKRKKMLGSLISKCNMSNTPNISKYRIKVLYLLSETSNIRLQNWLWSPLLNFVFFIVFSQPMLRGEIWIGNSRFFLHSLELIRKNMTTQVLPLPTPPPCF